MQNGSQQNILIPPLAIFIIMLAIYTYTLASTIMWGDPTKLMIFVDHGKPQYIGGGVHGLHTQMGMIFACVLPDSWSLAYKINFMSAFLASLTLSLVYLILYHLIASPVPAIGATLCIGFSHMFWFVATITETYSLLAFTFIMSLSSFILWYEKKNDWLLLLLAASLIIGFLNHHLTLLFVPVYAFFVLHFSKDRARIFSIYIFVALVGVVYFLTRSGAEVCKEILKTTYVHLTRFSDYGKLPKEMCLFTVYLMYQYPIAVFLGIMGLRSAKNKMVPVFGVTMLTVIIFASFFGKTRQLYQLIPAFLLFGYFIAIGIKTVTLNLNQKKTIILLATVILLQPITYFVVTRAASGIFNINLVSQSTFKYRDPNIYYLWPSKRGNYKTYDFVKRALSVMDENAVILADFNIMEPLKYLRNIEGFRKDVRIKCTDEFAYQSEAKIWRDLNRYIDEKLARDEKVYLAAYESLNFFTIEKNTVPFRQRLDKAYDIKAVGNIFLIKGKKPLQAVSALDKLHDAL